MGTSKAAPPAPYRDDPQPDYAETSSMASAVLLDDVESYLDEELPPAYEDTPSQSLPEFLRTAPYTGYIPPPELPFSSHDLGCTEFRTRFPNYSTEEFQLYQMLKQQAAHPPTYIVQLHGQHTEQRLAAGNKKEKDVVVDFHLRINITNLLGNVGTGELELLPDGKRGYRGTRIISLKPTVSDKLDSHDGRFEELRAWCERYVADQSRIKSFTLKRRVIHHDQQKLEQLLRAAIAECGYRGHLTVSFPMQHQTVIVYSPGLLNQWRITVWIRWLFYLTFLWILSWPVLFLATSRYEVVKSVWAYANEPPGGNEARRRCKVMSEVEWFNRWRSAVQSAAIGRLQCHDTFLDEAFRDEAEQQERRRGEYANDPGSVPSTGNAFADAAVGLLGHGLRVAEGFNAIRGWGGDS
jgi:hypothetical protein